jgi:DNA repair protein RecN (Recombination protein N)
MLSQLTVRNLAVVEDITLDFDMGMTSLTGETGAGKSMLVDALGLILGDRADSNMVRINTERAEIEALFDVSKNTALKNWLLENELDEEEDCHLRRTISKEGRSKAYINGRMVTVSQLKELGALSIDIHGQHAHQSLLRPQTQRELLDDVANNSEWLVIMHDRYHVWLDKQAMLDTLKSELTDKQARLDLLQYQVDEMAALDLSPAHIENLQHEHKVLSHSHQLIQAAESALNKLVEDEQLSAYEQLNLALRSLGDYGELSNDFANAIETLNAAMINIDETAGALRHYLDHADIDPQQLTATEDSLSTLFDLARKHQVDIDQLPELYQRLSEELSTLNNVDIHIADLEQEVETLYSECQDLAMKLHQRRVDTAPLLAKKITTCMQELAIASGQISFDIAYTKDNKLSETGYDQIKLMVATNPGQPAGELSKVASGGELARISLAIQVVTAGNSGVPTLIFDEVDVGIGGGVAEVVGQYLRQLGVQRQVLCVTHLPQVAAQAHHQLQVTKHQSNNSAAISVDVLTMTQRIDEIARMLGGVTLTDKTRSHAEEMLQQAQI